MTKSRVRTDMLDKFIESAREHQDETDVQLKLDMKNESHEKWMAHPLLCNSDQAKCGSLLTRLTLQFSMENQCPKQVRSAAHQTH